MNRLTKLAIDKSKGIVCKPMPREWHDWHAAKAIENEEKRALYRNIVVDRKPYFMRYIYPALMKQYNTYIKNADRNSLREFGMTVPELQSLDKQLLTDRQREFLYYYGRKVPVGMGDCVMNKICRRFEEEFDGYIGKHNSRYEFDYTIMKSDAEYTQAQYYAIKKSYTEFNKYLQKYKIFASYERIDKDTSVDNLMIMGENFRRECDAICSNGKSLCNIVLDLCYRKNSTKSFAWNMCRHEIIDNLLEKNNNIISFPVLCPDGELEYCGERFTVKSTEIGVH